MIGAHENAAESQLLDDAAGFLHGRRDIMRRDDRRPIHSRRRDFAEIEQPIVVGFGNGGRQVGIEAVDRQHEETAAGVKNRHVETFFVHGAQLRDVIEVACLFFRIALGENFLANRAQRRIGLFRRARHDLAVHLYAEVALVPVEPDGSAVEKSLVNVLLPQVARFHHMHVRIHRFETVFHTRSPIFLVRIRDTRRVKSSRLSDPRYR